jgi:FkbM family methyltransferase
VKTILKSLLRRFDINVSRQSTFDQLYRRAMGADDLDALLALPADHAPKLLPLLQLSRSQIRQDLFVLSTLNFKRNGYFVEFGATNGLDLSNSYLLEAEFGWSGILAEPARCWHEALRMHRTAAIDTRCVWSETGVLLNFNEVSSAELSTIDDFSSIDIHSGTRKRGQHYKVETVSLNDLLGAHNAPAEIDYLSIDTEGSEFEILGRLDFDRYRFRVITCEHNHTPAREKIHTLLAAHGYRRTLENISRFDDWYISA